MTTAPELDQIIHLPPLTTEPPSRTCHAAIDLILRRWDELIEVLTAIATPQAAADELNRSIATLAGAHWEIERHRPRTVDELAVFLPSNNAFYSYVLFAVVPSLYARRVLVRPSTRSLEVSRAVHGILTTDPALAGRLEVEFLAVSQRRFIARCSDSDVVVFNGRPENAETLAELLPRASILLAFGSGPNPVVVGPDADLATAVADLLRVRVYNSGQDCLCPDLVLVHDAVADEVLRGLCAGVRRLRVGPPTEHDGDVRPLVYPDAVQQIEGFLAAHREHVLAGGGVDRGSRLVEPTVLELPWSSGFHPPEFFGPVWCVMRYRDPGEVEAWLNSPVELARGMYVSIYGERSLRGPRIGTSVVTMDCTTLDVESGNQPLGGFGRRAGHARVNGTAVARPLLLSAELSSRSGTGGEDR